MMMEASISHPSMQQLEKDDRNNGYFVPLARFFCKSNVSRQTCCFIRENIIFRDKYPIPLFLKYLNKQHQTENLLYMFFNVGLEYIYLKTF